MSIKLPKLPLLVNNQNRYAIGIFAVHNTRPNGQKHKCTITVNQGDFTTGPTNAGHDRLCCLHTLAYICHVQCYSYFYPPH